MPLKPLGPVRLYYRYMWLVRVSAEIRLFYQGPTYMHGHAYSAHGCSRTAVDLHVRSDLRL
jgi:hypothetical protein